MKPYNIHLKRLGEKVFIISVFALILGCATISSFDQYAYVQTTSLKVDALEIMDLAENEFANFSDEISELRSNLWKIYEYEKNRPNNEITLKMWKKLLNKDGHLLEGYLVRWEKEDKLGKAFITESKK